MTKVRTLTANVRKFSLEYCDDDEPIGFKPAFEVELGDKGPALLQTEVHQVNCRAKFLKFIRQRLGRLRERAQDIGVLTRLDDEE